MSSRTQASRRMLAKKVTSFNMYLDQATQIQAIMEATGAEKDAPVLRLLLDEALAARRRRAAGIEEPEQLNSVNGFADALETLETLVLRTIKLGERSLRIEAVNLGLLQETLAETRATRTVCWTDLSVPPLRDRGIRSEEITARFDQQTRSGRAHAYNFAREIMSGGKVLNDTADLSMDQDRRSNVSPDDQVVDTEIDDNQPLLF